MLKLKTKLSLFNMLSKMAFTVIFILILPYVIERVNLRYIDRTLINGRESVLSIVNEIGIEPFITSDTALAFGSYNILKEEFISIERYSDSTDLNYIEESYREIEGDEILYRVLTYSFFVNNQGYLLEVGKSLESIRLTERNIRTVIIIFLLVIIVLTFIVDFEYSRRILKPLDQITGKLRQISDPSQFEMTPVLTTTEDFHKLDLALGELMSNISTLFQKEKEITINISHELLTPVAILRSRLENILNEGSVSSELQEKIGASLNTLNRIQSLVNSLLLIARIESHQYLREDSFNIREVLDEIINEITPIADDAGIKIKEDLVEGFIVNNFNRTLIYSMFYNIIKNSVKNTPAGGDIIVRFNIIDGCYSISVSDTGNGLTPEQMKGLFMRFKMRDANSPEGTGIGLAIAKSIADFHKISIKVDSKPSKGTIITFIFPENS